MAKKDTTFSQKEIGSMISNALIFSRSPAKLGRPIDDRRLRRLQAYAVALFEPLGKFVEAGEISPEESVFVCLAGAAYQQSKYVASGMTFPGTVHEKTLLEVNDETAGKLAAAAADYTCPLCGRDGSE
jgi:hypothetical protein